MVDYQLILRLFIIINIYVHCTLYSVQCTLYNVHYTTYILYNVYREIYSINNTTVHRYYVIPKM